jgi:bacteriocin biosynthesis cyclodehydratase domain-containing protein
MPITKTPMHTLWTGEFGKRTAGHLASVTGCPARPTDAHGNAAAAWPHAGVRVVATWRDEPALFDRVARLHTACRAPWLPVVHEYPLIRVGPLVVPGDGPCYRCYLGRRAQHDRGSDSTAALRASAAAAPGHGVTGFTDAQTMIAACLALDLLREHQDKGAESAGRVVFYNVLTRALITDTVMGVHGCRECGTPPHPDDGWRRLAADLDGSLLDGSLRNGSLPDASLTAGGCPAAGGER